MKRCAFCAEEIQDAAIVCKHCGRDLSAPTTVVNRSQPQKKMGAGKIAAIIVALLTAAWTVSYFYTDHQKFLAWTAQRDAWHSRCNQYVGKSTTFAARADREAATACATEFEALMTEAKTNGWTR